VKKLLVLLLTIISASCVNLFAQDTKDTIMVKAIISGTDTIPFAYLPSVNVYSNRIFKNKRQQVKYTKLRRDVLKVWPYAKIAGEKFNQLEKELSMTNDQRVQKALVSKTEKEIKEKFEDELKNLTITQGKILIKLIDRQTGNTSYAVLQDLKGNLSAFFWQQLARLFGSNLKAHYDPINNEEDIEIEKIIKSIE
jgi:hypothetical protein